MDLINEQEKEFDAMENIFKSRMRLKKIGQLSYEMKSLENQLGVDTYDSFNAPRISKMYELIELKVLEVAEDIKNNK